MYKLFLYSLIGILFLGCEIRRKDAPRPGFGSSGLSRDTSALLSIRRSQGNQTGPIIGNESRTSVDVRVVDPSAPSQMFEIITDLGNMTIRLYNDTPAHRDNFLKLVNDGFFDGTTFHRVISNFMIQGGDPYSKDNNPNNDGTGGPGYTVQAEILPRYYHKKGAIAAARQMDRVNPERRSNGSQFYIVQGRTFTSQELTELENYIGGQIGDSNFQFSSEARESYLRNGGFPSLDMQYTVFGELVDGFDVLDRISAVRTNSMDRPTEDVTMTIRAIPAQ